MATHLKNLSQVDGDLPDGSSFTIGIVVSKWNHLITGKLLEGALDALNKCGVPAQNMAIHQVPGTYELALGAQWLSEKCDAVICLGCVIQGETRHFDFICDAAAQGIMQVSLQSNKPIIFGVLTTENLLQAEERAGGKHGNKGFEAGLTAVEMLNLKQSVDFGVNLADDHS